MIEGMKGEQHDTYSLCKDCRNERRTGFQRR